MATKLTSQRVVRELREPLQTSYGELAERTTVTVTLEGDDGVVGVGEAAPLEAYDGVPLSAVEDALDAYARVIAPLDEGAEILAACQDVAYVPHALAAVDIALWDRAGKREGKRVADMLADGPLESVSVNATIGALGAEAAERASAEALAAGFPCVKVKVGTPGDAERLRAVRAGAGPGMSIRVDANGAWTVSEAAELLPALDEAAGSLELIEEPVHGAAEFAELMALLPDLRFASDESGIEAAPTACLKIGRAGGISAVCAHAAFVQARGGDVYLASAFDGPVGIAAAVHVAAALQTTIPSGLATLGAFTECEAHPFAPDAGAIRLPASSGLGLS